MSEATFIRVGQPLLERRWFTGAVAVLLLAASLLVGWQWEQRENRAQVRQVSGQAEILAASLAGALAFDDEATAREYVNALRRDSRIKAAGVYGGQGRLIVGMTRAGETLPARVEEGAPRVDGGTLTIVEPVREGALDLGRVYLRTAIEPLSARLSRYLAIGIVLVLAALLIALLGAANAAAATANRQLQEQVAAREQAERALRQAQKMEALGQLTGGVAHDFNNLLMAASSGLELLDRAKTDERRQNLKAAIRDALERGARITEQLLAFSRRRPVRSEVVQIQQHMTKLDNLLEHSLREDIAVEFAIDPELWPVEVDVSQLDIAILNLAVNAKDAMERGGTLRISADNRGAALEGADAVVLSVADEGAGMTGETLDRAFEPFFTTKEVGKGTGLGLSQVFGFARASGGRVTIESLPMRGTTVSILLPRAAARAPEAAAQTGAVAATHLHGLRVLLVEDDPNLNDLVSQMLEEHGAQVQRASNGAEGLALFGQQPVDAVLSDMVMPGGMNGLELAHAILDRRDGQPIVLMTGYSESAGAAPAEGFPVLRKPFTLETLAATFAQLPRQAG